MGVLVAVDAVDARTALDLGWWPWHLYSLLCIVATLRYLLQRRPEPEPGALRPHHLAFLLIPLLVVANGFTPYTEIKTGYGWNMYANLRTVDGDSNHFVIRRTLPLTDEQADLVRIISTDDPGLARYAERGYALTWTQARIYLSDHPDVRITYARGNEVVGLRHASDRPALVEPVPVWREKLLLFRAVDLELAGALRTGVRARTLTRPVRERRYHRPSARLQGGVRLRSGGRPARRRSRR